MAFNNTVTLTGNLGVDPEIIESGDKTFAVLSLATTDSYKDKETDQWINKESVWHRVTIFGSKLIEHVQSFQKGDRISVTGSLSYRPHDISNDEGKSFKIMEASVIAGKIEAAPLVKKDAHPTPSPE